MPRVSIPDRHKPALRELQALSADEIASIRSEIDLSNARYQVMQNVFARHVKLAAEALEATITLALVSKRMELSDSDIRDSLNHIAENSDSAADLMPVVSAPAIKASGKALELRNGYERILLESRIFSDIRPIFDDEDVGSIVRSAMVNHTLQIGYQSANDAHEIHIALDKSDLLKLKAQIERALTKDSAAQAMIEKSGATVMEPLERE